MNDLVEQVAKGLYETMYHAEWDRGRESIKKYGRTYEIIELC
jgi:hypothetical protein